MRFRDSRTKLGTLFVVALLVALVVVPIAYAGVGVTTYYSLRNVPTKQWSTNQLNAGEIDYGEGEAVPHGFRVTGLTPNTTYSFFIEAYIRKDSAGTPTCGYDYLTSYNYTDRLVPIPRLPVATEDPVANGLLPTTWGAPGGFMYTTGVQPGSVTVNAPYITQTGGTYTQYWAVRFTASASTAYFYFGLRLALPNSQAGGGICANATGASQFSGGSLETSIVEQANKSYPTFSDAPTNPPTIDGEGPVKVTVSAVFTTVFRGQKWYDLDADGNMETGEPPLANWTMRLYNCGTIISCASRTLAQTTYTSSTGGNYYSGVIFGTTYPRTNWYQVCEVLPASWINSHPTSWGTTAEICGTPIRGDSTLPQTQNFGNFQTDWGDLPYDNDPDTPAVYLYGTTRAQNGPYHVLYPDTNADGLPDTLSTDNSPAIWLGAAPGRVDRETDGIPTTLANGDDINQTLNDEDGITLGIYQDWWHAGFPGSLTATFNSSTGSGSGCFVVWFDWNHDGDFNDSWTLGNELAIKKDVSWTSSPSTQTFNEFIVPYCENPSKPGTCPLDKNLYYRARLFAGACPTGTPSYTGQAINGEVEDYRYEGAPTAVELLWFTATGIKRAIQLGWETAAEFENAGFNLYRATSPDGTKTRLNAELIPSLVPPGSGEGAVYEYIDRTAQGKKTYYYWLEDVDFYGQTHLYGPITGQAR